MLRIIEAGGYWGILLLMALENVVPPIPSEVIMGFGGIAVARGTFAFWPLLAFGTVGTLAGNYAWFMVGRVLGYERLRPIVDRWGHWLTLDWSDVEAINAFFLRHGGKVVFVCRFLPTFRTMISLPAGLARMPHWRFALATFTGAAIWNTLLIAAGYCLGTRFRTLESWLGPAAIVIFAGVMVLYVYRVLTWRPR